MSEAIEFQNEVTHLLRSGFYTLDEAKTAAQEIVEFTGSDFQSNILAQKSYDQVMHEQSQWTGVNDCDRLIQAFDDLRAQGVVCCENFSCCGTCGSSEIWEVIDIAQQAGQNVVGYVFYHQQDTEHAVEGDGLYFNYGAVSGPSEATAHALVTSLRNAGLSPDWNGSSSTRVFVPLQWQRRMLGA